MSTPSAAAPADDVDPSPAPEEPSDPDARPGRQVERTGRTPKDMVLSLVVLLVPLALLAGFLSLTRGNQEGVVNPDTAISEARSAQRFPVAVPEGLGPDWRPASAGFTTADAGATLRIGYRTPGGAGAQFVASDVPAEDLMVAELTDKARPRGTEAVGGRTWQVYDGRPGEMGLVLLEPDRTIIVFGTAPIEELRVLAAAIR